MKKTSILLVEDNPDHAKLTINALVEGYIQTDVALARDGQEALDYLFCQGEFANRSKVNPEVILLDLKLPKISGLEVLKEIRANEATKLIPVIILTTSSSAKDIEASYNRGANSYIIKPVTAENFSTSIRQFIHYWVGMNIGFE